jgi:hypothetical protein
MSPSRLRVACIWFSTPTDLTNFAEACLRFSPQIAIRGQQAVFIEIGKSHTLFSEEAFLKRVQVLLKKFELRASGAVRSNVIDALLAARYATDLLVKIPLEGLHLVIDPFAVSRDASKAVDRMIHSLEQLGLRTLEDFFNLPIHELPSRFGAPGLLCRQHLERPNLTWPKWSPREVIEESVELSYDDYCSTLEPLLFKAKILLDRLFARLRGRGLRLTRLHSRFELEKFSTVKKPVHEWDFDLMLPQGSTSGVVPILQERWDRDLQRTPLETSVLKIQFIVTETTTGYEGQKNFFHDRDDQEERMNSVASHLAESLGRDKVFRVSLIEDRIPEKSWKRKIDSKKETPVDLTDQIPLRPTRLLNAPQPIEVTREQVKFRNRFFTIERWSEAESISVHWLDRLQARRYFTIDIIEGPSLWVYQDKANDEAQYYLHGYFE